MKERKLTKKMVEYLQRTTPAEQARNHAAFKQISRGFKKHIDRDIYPDDAARIAKMQVRESIFSAFKMS